MRKLLFKLIQLMPFLSRLWMEKSTSEHNAVSQATEVAENEEGNEDKSMVKLTKAERRARLKKSKKEAKKQGKELAKTEVQPTQQEAVLAEVKEDLTAEEAFEGKKRKLVELGMALLADPEANIKSLKGIMQFSKDGNHSIVKLGLLSTLAVLEDIIPGYRIRLPTEKELEMKVSKEVKKMRYHESTLISSYKGYLQKLLALEKQPIFHHVVVCCICTLLDAVPRFNFRKSLLAAVIRNIGSSDDVEGDLVVLLLIHFLPMRGSLVVKLLLDCSVDCRSCESS